jgi:acetyl-CoA carboxylase biotin carboxyl carrier protein
MDLKQIKSLVQLMVENDISRLELREADTHILLRRGQPPVLSAGPVALTTAPAQPAAAEPAKPQGPEETTIRSPMVGTFYSAADPESPPFVNVGDELTPEKVVCLIEAMKVFNEIKAEVTGRVSKVLVKNAEAVEFDQPLFAVVPS